MKTKRCTKCKEIKNIDLFWGDKKFKDGKGKWCKSCSQINSKKWQNNNIGRVAMLRKKWEINNRAKRYQFNKEYRERNKNKVKVWNFVKTEIYHGRITRQPCAICKTTPTEGHHSDYNKPLDITWLCRKHHLEAHDKVQRIELIRELQLEVIQH